MNGFLHGFHNKRSFIKIKTRNKNLFTLVSCPFILERFAIKHDDFMD